MKLLNGDVDFDKWVGSAEDKRNEGIDEQDDEVYPNSSAELHLGLAFDDVDDDTISDTISYSSMEQNKNVFSFEEYLKERWSRSSSFNKY